MCFETCLGFMLFAAVGLMLLTVLMFLSYTVFESESGLLRKTVTLFGLAGVGFGGFGCYILFLQQIASIAF
jgi:hypothetical protein